MAEASVNLQESGTDLRESFREYESGIAFDNARRAAVFAAVFMLAASSLDWVIIADYGLEFLLIRATCAVLLFAVYDALAVVREERAKGRSDVNRR